MKLPYANFCQLCFQLLYFFQCIVMNRTHTYHAATVFQAKPLGHIDGVVIPIPHIDSSLCVVYAVEMFDRVWRETPPYSDRYHYARFLSHLTKNRTAEHGAAATQLAMELFGGLGFLDDFGIR